MQHDLIVFVSDGEREAQRVQEALQGMRKSPLLGVNRVVMIRKDSNGRVSVLQRRDLSSDSDRKNVQVLDHLAELIFGEPSPAVLDGLERAGLDTRVLSLIGTQIPSGSSALLFLLDRDGMEDTDELLDALSLFRGMTYRTTLSEETIAAILEPNLYAPTEIQQPGILKLQ